MPRIKKAPQYRYGIEITKPFSKKMYDHNDAIALEMKRHITSEIHKAYSNDNEDLLRKIGSAIEGMGYGDGYDLEDVKDGAINTLANIENWQIHQEYGYLCSEGIVPKLRMKVLGFDKAEDGCWDCYWEDGDVYISLKDGVIVPSTDIPGFEGTLEALDNLTIKVNPKFELSPNQLKNLIKEELKKDIK